MPAISIPRQLSFEIHSVHAIVVLFTFVLIALAPNIVLLPEAWRGSLYNEKRILEVTLLCSYGLALILSRPARESWYATLASLPLTAKICFAAVLGLGLLSALFSARPDAAMLEVTTMGMLFVLTLGIATFIRQSGTAISWILCSTFALMALAYEARFMTGVLVAQIEEAPLSIHDLFMGFSNLRFFNHIQTWTLPLLALPVLWSRGRSPVLAFITFIALSLWWLLLFISSGRGVLIAVCAGALVTVVVFRKTSLPWIKVQIGASIAALAAYFLFYRFILSPVTSFSTTALPQRLAHTFEDPARLRLWEDAWHLFLQNPILGAGPMHYAYYFQDISLHPHNSIMQLLSEWGLPTTLLLLLLSLWGAFAWIKQARGILKENTNQEALIQVALLASISGAAAHSLVCGIIVTPLSQLLAASVIGLMLGNYPAIRNSLPIMFSRHQHDMVLIGGLAIAVLILGWATVTTLFGIEGSLSSEGQVLSNPRFWVPGQL